jgi:hypothetical protein
MYKTVLKKRSATITRRNISPRTDPEPQSPSILEAPKIAFNIVYPPMNFSRVQNVLARTIVGAKNWNYVDDESRDVVANWAYDVNGASLNIDVNNFNYGDTVDICSTTNGVPSQINVNTNIECDADIPRIAVRDVQNLDISAPVAFGTSITGSMDTIDTYSVITDSWSLRIYSAENSEFIYDTDQFETITSVAVIGNVFWCACPSYHFDSNTETNYSLIKGTISYNSTTHVYTVTYEYYFSTVSVNKVCLSTAQYDIEDLGNWIGVLTSNNLMYVSSNNGENWYAIESLDSDYTWNDMSITNDGFALIVGNNKVQFIDIDDDDDESDDFLVALKPENWVSCSLLIHDDLVSMVIASENSAYASTFNWWETPSWKRLLVNDLINQVHTVFMDEINTPIYTIATKNHLYYIDTSNDVLTATKYGFNGNYTHLSFNWELGVYTTIQTGSMWFEDITLQTFLITDLSETMYAVDTGLFVWGNAQLTLRRDVNGNFNLKTTKDSSSIVWAIPTNSINALTNNQEPFTETVNLFAHTVPPNYRVPLETQPERTLKPFEQADTHTNIIIPTVAKFIKPNAPTDTQLTANTKRSHILEMFQKFKSE